MDEPVLMRRGQALGDLAANAEHLRCRQLRLAFQPRLQALALQKLHGEKQHAAIFTGLVDLDEVIVLQLGRELRLTNEALPRLGTDGHARPQRLDCDRTLEMRVFGLKDDAQAAQADDFEDAVVPEPAYLTGRLGRRQIIRRLWWRRRRLKRYVQCRLIQHLGAGLVVRIPALQKHCQRLIGDDFLPRKVDGPIRSGFTDARRELGLIAGGSVQAPPNLRRTARALFEMPAQPTRLFVGTRAARQPLPLRGTRTMNHVRHAGPRAMKEGRGLLSRAEEDFPGKVQGGDRATT